MEKIKACYFSPTGGTKKAAEMVAGGMAAESGAEVISVELCSRPSEAEERIRQVSLCCDDAEKEVWILAVPSFGGRVPEAAAQRIAAMRGNGASAVLLAVYGNREYEDTLVELYDIAVESGFYPAAAVAAVAQHSIAERIAEGRPDGADEVCLSEFGRKIAKYLDGGGRKRGDDEKQGFKVPGNRPYRKYDGVSSLQPKAGDACTGCGACARKCPVGAIPAEEPQRRNKKVCISCMGCIAVCPEGARRLNPVMRKAVAMKLAKSCAERKEPELYLP